MAIPSGDVAHALAFERLVPVDEILEDLVQGVADVEVAVGVGRAVVQGEELGVLALGDLLVHALVRPELLDGGLLGDRVGAHLEGGLGEEDGVPVDVLLLLTLATLALALLGAAAPSAETTSVRARASAAGGTRRRRDERRGGRTPEGTGRTRREPPPRALDARDESSRAGTPHVARLECRLETAILNMKRASEPRGTRRAGRCESGEPRPGSNLRMRASGGGKTPALPTTCGDVASGGHFCIFFSDWSACYLFALLQNV